jgi:cobalt/nickel transport system permease protein
MIGFGLYRMVSGRSKGVRLAMAGAAAWLATMAAALLTALQLWLSGTTRLEIVFPAMMGVHLLIGIGEAVITVAAIAFIEQTRPDLISADKSAESGGRGWVIAGLVVTLLAVLISPFASGNPDGLERVAEDIGFLNAGVDAPYQILPDYTIPFLGETGLSTVVAGVVGALVLFGLLVLIGRNLRKKEKTR